MTEALASKTCTPCRGGIPPLTREQAELFLAQAPDWQLVEEAHRIERSFRFRTTRLSLFRRLVNSRKPKAIIRILGSKQSALPPLALLARIEIAISVKADIGAI